MSDVDPPPGLLGQTVVIIGSTGAGVATARRAKSAGAQLVITDRRAGPLEELADDIGVEAIAVFDESDVGQLETFLGRLPGSVDHVMLTGGPPHLGALARYAQREMRDGGSLVFVGGTRAVVANLAVQTAPVRVNSIVGAGRPNDVAALAIRLMTDPAMNAAIVEP